MAKQITSVIKLNIPAGKGTPAPPVGPGSRSGWHQYDGVPEEI